MKPEQTQVVIIGCGPAGATTAAYLARSGADVVVIERQRFPRYHVGESLTSIAADYLRDLGVAHEMDERQMPVKTGVKVIGANARSDFFVPVLRPTWQVRRDEFDEVLMRRAVELGADIRQGSVREVMREGGKVTGVRWKHADDADEMPLRELRARVVVDCSGSRCLLSRQGIAGPKQLDEFGRQIAVFTQYEHAVRDHGDMGNNTFIFYSELQHWAWFIPLSPTLTSVGVVVPTSTYKRVSRDPEAAMAWGARHINPDLRRRLAGLEPVEPVRVVNNYSYRVEPYVGDGWLCVADAHRFVDPIFSFGVAAAMTEGEAAARAVREALATGDCRVPFERFREMSDRGQDAVYDLIRYFWRFPAFFAYQTRGERQPDFIRMMSGDLFGTDRIATLESMRQSLAVVNLNVTSQRTADGVTRMVQDRASDLQGVSAAFIDASEDGVRLALVLESESELAWNQVGAFEDRLYDDFGRDGLAIVALPQDLVDSLRGDPLLPGHAIFDRRVA